MSLVIRALGLSAALAALTACGLDGAPDQPEGRAQTAPKPGITVSGDARVGVVGSF